MPVGHYEKFYFYIPEEDRFETGDVFVTPDGERIICEHTGEYDDVGKMHAGETINFASVKPTKPTSPFFGKEMLPLK